MPDPYASRPLALRPLDGPGGEPPWRAALGGRLLVLEDPGSSGAEPGRPAAVPVADGTVLAPVARLEPPLAALLLTLEAGGGEAAAALAGFRAREAPVYLVKHGPVAGPAGSDGCAELDPDALLAVVEADSRGEVVWERDPDFGYGVAVSVPGLGEERVEVLCPRLRYAAHHRAYEHADLVAETKRIWRERSGRGGELPEEVAAAIGWPPVPTGTAWKD